MQIKTRKKLNNLNFFKSNFAATLTITPKTGTLNQSIVIKKGPDRTAMNRAAKFCLGKTTTRGNI